MGNTDKIIKKLEEQKTSTVEIQKNRQRIADNFVRYVLGDHKIALYVLGQEKGTPCFDERRASQLSDAGEYNKTYGGLYNDFLAAIKKHLY